MWEGSKTVPEGPKRFGNGPKKVPRRPREGPKTAQKLHPKVSKIVDETEEAYEGSERSYPRYFWGLKRASGDPLGAPKTAQDSPKKAARRPKMGLGGLEDGRRERPQIPRWFQEPGTWLN